MTTEVQNNNDVWAYDGMQFKVGDTVRIAFNGGGEWAPVFKANGMGDGVDWDNKWEEEMDIAVGGVHDIEEINEHGVYFVNYVDDASLHPHRGYGYPLSVLTRPD